MNSPPPNELGFVQVKAVAYYGDNPVGSFLDSEGNKLWFCSDSGKA